MKNLMAFGKKRNENNKKKKKKKKKITVVTRKGLSASNNGVSFITS